MNSSWNNFVWIATYIWCLSYSIHNIHFKNLLNISSFIPFLLIFISNFVFLFFALIITDAMVLINGRKQRITSYEHWTTSMEFPNDFSSIFLFLLKFQVSSFYILPAYRLDNKTIQLAKWSNSAQFMKMNEISFKIN